MEFATTNMTCCYFPHLSGDPWERKAAQAVLETGFRQLCLQEMVAFTAMQNVRSRAVMSRIGMVYEGETFEHPGIAPGHPLKMHVLYRIKNSFTASPTR
jgi:RimJ/RimL family protein N-acetyltransferase